MHKTLAFVSHISQPFAQYDGCGFWRVGSPHARGGIAVGSATVSGSGVLNAAENQTLTYNGIIANNGSGTGGLTTSSLGTLTLTGNNNAGGLGSAGAGSYLLISYTGSASGNFSGVTGLPQFHNAFHDVPADKVLYIDLYNYAVAEITPSADLGRIHAGGTFGTEVLTISNTAPAGNFTESLSGNFTSIPAGFTANGSVTEIAGGSSNNSSMVVGISDNTAGAKNGTVTLSFTSLGVPTSGLGNTALASTGSILGDTVIQGGGTITGPGPAGSLVIEGSPSSTPASGGQS